jgi:hypothetical protein
VLERTGVHPAAADLPFRLVESLVNMWSEPPGPGRSELPVHVADACLRVLGSPDAATPRLRDRSAAVIERHRAGAGGPTPG